MSPHLHKFLFESKTANNHKHRLSGYTDRMIGVYSFHIHYFGGISSYNGHTHYFSGVTGLPVRTEHGHIHKIEGILEFNAAHEHRFRSVTFEDVGYIPKKMPTKAYI